MIRALIFDFDGLIMDTESAEVEAWKTIYAEYGQEFPLEDWVRKVVGSTTDGLDPVLHLAQLTGRSLDRLALHERARTDRLARQAALTAMPGVVSILQQAKRLGLRLAIASSSPRAWVEGYLRQLGLWMEFDSILCREDVTYVKPAPDLFLVVLRRLALTPSQALVFEDSPNGILAAKRAGLRVVAVPNPVTERGDFRDADLMLRSLADLPLREILRRVGASPTQTMSIDRQENLA